jgi:hypothetical protein
MKKIIVFAAFIFSCYSVTAQSAKAEWVIFQWKINLLQGEVRIQFLPDRTSADEVRVAVNNAGFDTDIDKALDEAYKKLPPSCKRATEGGGPQLRKPCHIKPYL